MAAAKGGVQGMTATTSGTGSLACEAARMCYWVCGAGMIVAGLESGQRKVSYGGRLVIVSLM